MKYKLIPLTWTAIMKYFETTVEEEVANPENFCFLHQCVIVTEKGTWSVKSIEAVASECGLKITLSNDKLIKLSSDKKKNGAEKILVPKKFQG